MSSRIKVIYAYQTGSKNERLRHLKGIRDVVDAVDANLGGESARYGIKQSFRWARNLVGKVKVYTVAVENSSYDAIVDVSRAVRTKFGHDGKNLVFFKSDDSSAGNSFVAGVFSGFTPSPYTIFLATHELLHTFSVAHTFDADDIMYGKLTGGPTFDTSHDRYYNPFPEPGSWLAEYPAYNVALSPYLKTR